MKLRLSLLLASVSVILIAARVETARRPGYGGTLRAEIGAVVTSLDPAVPAANPEEAAAKEQIDALLYGARNAHGTFDGVAGSGPFRIAAWDPGKRAMLAANEDYRGGRPFVDSVEILMGRAAKDRLLDLELDRADFAEIPPEDARAASGRGVRVSASAPDELVALVFVPGRSAAQDARVREALARSIDRAAIVNFILQKTGEPAGGLLPQWSSGTAFLFSAAADPARAKELASQVGGPPRMVLGYDAADPLAQAMAERIAVNAKDAGITLDAQRAGGAAEYDVRLVRLRMASANPREALAHFVAVLNPLAGIEAAAPAETAFPEQIYATERAIVTGGRVIPLVWLPRVYGLGARVRDWRTPASGESWPLADVWIEGAAGTTTDKGNP
jgi:peptide/nickel transport system substrate-binding protein